MILFFKIIAGFFLDCMLGDPHSIKHPVQRIGSYITFTEKWCRKMAKGDKKKEVIAGGILCGTTVFVSYFVIWAILYIAGIFHPLLRHGIEVWFIYRILASKSLVTETLKVYQKLKEEDLIGARKELSYLVGRDTEELSKEEVIKATIETIAENTSDGVIAPLFFIAIGGAPLGMAYKAVNTLDSMVGYRNEKYEYLGKVSAKCDDICNLIPARISAFLILAVCALLGYDGKKGVEVYARDRYKHLSPNSAQTESVVAGALNIQLGGTHNYFGKPVEKPTIGDNTRSAKIEDIKRTQYLMYGSTVLMIICIGLVYSVFY
ncbi:MAG TPA: cobalamin biosynthesis protein CobD [Candidatus Scybalomonas excrementigallinarum]|nr:cobalamin biosynthesis protein CobD [Candidatus Scybalomonas excrementigallinarum]